MHNVSSSSSLNTHENMHHEKATLLSEKTTAHMRLLGSLIIPHEVTIVASQHALSNTSSSLPTFLPSPS
jgi:hypothetical protein